MSSSEEPPELVKICLVGARGVGKRRIASTYLSISNSADKAAPQLARLEEDPVVTVDRVIGTVPIQVRISCVTEFTTEKSSLCLAGADLVALVFDLSRDPKFAGAADVVSAITRIIATRRGRGHKFGWAVLGSKTDLCGSEHTAQLAVTSAARSLRTACRYAVSTEPSNRWKLCQVLDELIGLTYGNNHHGLSTSGASNRAAQPFGAARVTSTEAGSHSYGTVRSSAVLEGTEEYDDDYDGEERVAKGILRSMPALPSAAPLTAPPSQLTLENNPLAPADQEFDTPVSCAEVCRQS